MDTCRRKVFSLSGTSRAVVLLTSTMEQQATVTLGLEAWRNTIVLNKVRLLTTLKWQSHSFPFRLLFGGTYRTEAGIAGVLLETHFPEFLGSLFTGNTSRDRKNTSHRNELKS